MVSVLQTQADILTLFKCREKSSVRGQGISDTSEYVFSFLESIEDARYGIK